MLLREYAPTVYGPGQILALLKAERNVHARTEHEPPFGSYISYRVYLDLSEFVSGTESLSDERGETARIERR